MDRPSETSIDSQDKDDTSAAFKRITTVIWATCKQGKNCKGICHRIEQHPPYGKDKYKNHAFCSRCGSGDGTWMNINVLVPTEKRGLVCPCCNFRPRQKNFKQ